MWRSWEEHRVASHKDQWYSTEEKRYLSEITQGAYMPKKLFRKPEGLRGTGYVLEFKELKQVIPHPPLLT